MISSRWLTNDTSSWRSSCSLCCWVEDFCQSVKQSAELLPNPWHCIFSILKLSQDQQISSCRALASICFKEIPSPAVGCMTFFVQVNTKRSYSLPLCDLCLVYTVTQAFITCLCNHFLPSNGVTLKQRIHSCHCFLSTPKCLESRANHSKCSAEKAEKANTST